MLCVQILRMVLAWAVVIPPCVFSFRVSARDRISIDAPDSSSDNEFFLTKQEITASRNGKERSDLRVSSADNTIQFISNGCHIMRRIMNTLEKTGPGDFIYATFFELNTDMMLNPSAGRQSPEKIQDEASRLINVLERATKRGAKVRLTVTLGSLQEMMGTSRAECAKVVERCGPFSCIVDQRHGSPITGSQHQKMWMVRTGDKLTAFVGSMDVAMTRFDTPAHNTFNSSRWRKQFEGVEGLAAERQFPWHDTMYEIQGSAAEDVLKTFVSRWNDPVPPTASDELIPEGEKLSLWLPSEQKDFRGYHGTLAVQVLRTYSCDGTLNKIRLRKRVPGTLPPLFQNFAPHGEYSYAAAFFKALRQAKQYIFIADQFMWFDEAMKAVVEAASRNTIKFVIVLTNPGLHAKAHIPKFGNVTVDTYREIVQHYQYEALFGALAAKDPSGELAKKVRMFSLVGEHTDKLGNNLIYDHEKTLLIDDEYALVGSHGVERTAFTNDADLSIGVHSKRFVRKLRRKMFSEWLQLPVKHHALSSIKSSFREWLRQADEGKRRVRNYMPKQQMSWAAARLAPLVYNYLEADGRCVDDGYTHMWPAVLDAGTDRIQAHLDEMRSHWVKNSFDKMLG